MNQVNLIGRITKDIKLAQNKNGKLFTFFTLAVNTFTKEGNSAIFVPCIAWQKTAEIMERYLHKGDLIAIEGKLNISSKEENGKWETSVNITVLKIHFTGKNENKQSDAGEFNPADWETKEVKKIETQQDDDSVLWDD